MSAGNGPPGMPPSLPGAPPPLPGAGSPPGFAPGSGRPRPAFEPRRISCPNCAAQLEIKNEQSLTAVCTSCRSQLELSAAEIKVLRQADRRGALLAGFDLEIGDSFRHKKARYEVIARLRYDEEECAPTRQYMLYNPRHGTLWLSEYELHWDLSRTSRLTPDGEPTSLRKGDLLRSHDGREWLLAGKGIYKLTYVDGALPWVATPGDTLEYAELEAADGSGETYEVSYPLNQGMRPVASEMEIGRGQLLTTAAVRSATRKQVPEAEGPRDDVVGMKRYFRFTRKAALVALVANLFFMFFCMAKGREVLDQELPREGLSHEVLTKPFEVRKNNSVVRVDLRAPLDNAWMSVQYALVRDDEVDPQVIHVSDEDLSYYSGRDGGESWSEGSKDKSQFVRVDKSGVYRLLVKAASGTGETSDKSRHTLRVRVIDGAKRALWVVLAAIFSFVIFIVQAVQYQAWRVSDDEEEDDD